MKTPDYLLETLYHQLLSGQMLGLTEHQERQLRSFGLTLQSESQYYYLSQREDYHFPYQQKEFQHLAELSVHLLGITTSTLHITPQKLPALILAEAQTHGRGRYQRSWYSPLGRQILLTYITHPHTLKHRPLDALWALKQIFPQLAFKWPNDLYSRNGKVAGCLIHSSPSSYSLSFGLNLTLNPIWPIGSLNLGPEKISRPTIIYSWLKNLSLAQKLSAEDIVSELAFSSLIQDNEEVMYDDKLYLFKGLCDDGKAELYHSPTQKKYQIAQGSLQPADPLGWLFQQSSQRSCSRKEKSIE